MRELVSQHRELGRWSQAIQDANAPAARETECAIQVCYPETYVIPIRPRLIGLRFGQSF